MSFHRLLIPYFISALVIAVFAFVLSDYVLPRANKVRLAFEEIYVHTRPFRFKEKNIHRQIEPGVYI